MLTSENSTERGCRTSALQLAQKCPWACQKIYGEKIQGQKNEAALFGTMLHNILEQYGEHCLKLKLDTDYDYFDSLIEPNLAPIPYHMHNGGRLVAKALKDRVNFMDDNQADYATVEIRIMLDENMEATHDKEKKYFSSGIDKLYITQGVAYACDYKSYRKISTRTELEASLQKDYYPFLIFCEFPDVEVVEFTFDFIRYGYICKPFVFTRTDDFERLKASLKASIEYFYKLVDTDEVMEARPSGFCTLCEVPGICPAVDNALVKEARIKCLEDAVKCALELKAGERKIAILKEVLSAYTDAHGSIPISKTEEYGRSVEDGIEIEDTYGLIQALLDAGVKKGPLFDELRLSKKSIDKLLTKYNVGDFNMSRFTRVKKMTKLRYKTPEEDGDESSDT